MRKVEEMKEQASKHRKETKIRPKLKLKKLNEEHLRGGKVKDQKIVDVERKETPKKKTKEEKETYNNIPPSVVKTKNRQSKRTEKVKKKTPKKKIMGDGRKYSRKKDEQDDDRNDKEENEKEEGKKADTGEEEQASNGEKKGNKKQAKRKLKLYDEVSNICERLACKCAKKHLSEFGVKAHLEELKLEKTKRSLAKKEKDQKMKQVECNGD